MRSQTHFEQIPVETVKKISKELPEENNAIEDDRVSAESQDDATAPQEDWRELAQKVQQEQDPSRMAELVQQLIAKFDEEKLATTHVTQDPKAGNNEKKP